MRLYCSVKNATAPSFSSCILATSLLLLATRKALKRAAAYSSEVATSLPRLCSHCSLARAMTWSARSQNSGPGAGFVVGVFMKIPMQVRASLHRGAQAVQPRGCRSGRLQDLFDQHGERLADVEHHAVFIWLQGLQGSQLAVEQAGRHEMAGALQAVLQHGARAVQVDKAQGRVALAQHVAVGALQGRAGDDQAAALRAGRGDALAQGGQPAGQQAADGALAAAGHAHHDPAHDGHARVHGAETMTVTRRFSAWPALVAFEATGLLMPRPLTAILPRGMPATPIASATTLARASDSLLFSTSAPSLSVWPSTRMWVMPTFSKAALIFWMAARLGAVRLEAPKSNSSLSVKLSSQPSSVW